MADAPVPDTPKTATGLMPLAPEAPVWLRDIARFLSVRSQFFLTGNIRDYYLVPAVSGPVPLTLHQALWALLECLGFRALLLYDRVDYFQVYPKQPQAIEAVKRATGLEFRPDGGFDQTLLHLPDFLKRLLSHPNERIALLFDYADRLPVNLQSLSENENAFFSAALKLSQIAAPSPGPEGRLLFNPIFWTLENINELPPWLMVHNERVRQQAIQKPDFDTRERTAAVLSPEFRGYSEVTPERRTELAKVFAAMTEGLSLAGMIAVTQMARDQQTPLTDVADAVRAYTLGVVDNPWKRPHLRRRIERAEETIGVRVKGQHQAIVKTADILRRSVMGLTGAQASASTVSGRPRGVLFFAGPTGVGKTELAKAITELLFDDERAYIRFDMSEFAQEHTEARLIGAPPGYIGFDAGGELTRAVRERPFSVLLFDEIEKAHPRIFDKFLQILEDGRLTDGRGDTVYFSESILIFTSNLGIYVQDETGRRHANVDASMPFETVEEKIRAAISNYFRFQLGRPEIQNRMGDNIVVFNFIQPEIARQIFDKMLDNIVRRVFDGHRLTLEIAPAVRARLEEWALSDLSNGGRGIGNRLESCFVNPLSRALFARDPAAANACTVEDIQIVDDVYSVVLR